ncbi:hypothetical protein HS041_30255 [Planomonospora sp. ID67723]|uniref:hypothetical protein n=1 Tax=Planomonospora sp. ID67723 TaxID=2738134 RepID=UPI0018C44320|nr:hypothetical protein [Planomonospora sp. ID67723]MBG0831991.1 hypothetical protein [Planomonospora sp. ID67723]
MIHPLIIPVLVTTDLPPQTDLTVFGQLLADTVTLLRRPGAVPYPGHLHGGVFWLDRPAPAIGRDAPAPAVEPLRFAALLGFLSVALEAPQVAVKDVLADARTAITTAVATAYDDLGSPPAVLAIGAQDVRERTPENAVRVATAKAVPRLAWAARTQPVS